MKGNAKIGSITLQFGKSETDRYMVALKDIKVMMRVKLSYLER